MPDPNVNLPAKVVKRGSKYVVTDANGEALPGTGSFADADGAGAVRDRINGAWNEAKSTRKAKGAPEITREARVLARALGIAVQLEELSMPSSPIGQRLHVEFDPRLHRRNRLGEFAKMAERLKASPHGSTVQLPSGVTMRRTVAGLEVSGPSGSRRPGVGGLRPFHEHLDDPHAAAAMALRQHDAKDRETAPDPSTIDRQTMSELATARRKAMGGQDSSDWKTLEDEIAKVRREISERQRAEGGPAMHAGRTRASVAQYREQHHRVDAATGAKNIDDAFAAARKVHARKRERQDKIIRKLGLNDYPPVTGKEAVRR